MYDIVQCLLLFGASVRQSDHRAVYFFQFVLVFQYYVSVITASILG